jgi:5'-3' exonuclease
MSSGNAPERFRVHVVDGTYELFRSFFGAPPQQHGGREVGATRAFLRSLLRWAQETHVTHCGVAFDTVIESFRNRLFDGYKTGEGVDPSLMEQFPLAEEAAAALGFVVWPMIEFECDDALATAAHRFRDDPRVEQVVIVSPDKDLAQCVQGQRVVCLDRLRGKLLDEPGVHAKFGVGPESIPDYLALVGDSADGLPGVPRWGAKSAAGVLARWKHLEAIPELPIKWDTNVRGALALSASLNERRADAFLYRTLATLRTDVPLTETLDDLGWKGPNPDRMRALCAKTGDTEILSRLEMT